SKGAPQVILDLCRLSDPDRAQAERTIDDLAAKGYRTLGVARSTDEGAWQFLGVLPLFDPPREDSPETIRRAREHGVQVKMVTGDDVAIARQISGQLGLGQNIRPAADLTTDAEGGGFEGAAVEDADGFAQVFPEHKYRIVKRLQALGHIVGMTGDGVNDAPALKQADTGVAVSGATDAARAAADLVLVAPGLSVIVRAIEEARKIFERMNSYAIYRITETIRIMVFVVLAMTVFDFYPITAIMIILLAFFNDVPIMAIAYDNTWLDPKPVRWDMRRILTVSTVLGLIGVIETFGLLVLGRVWLGLDTAQIQSFIFLKLAVAGHLTLFVARTRKPFLSRPHPAPLVLWSAIITKIMATLLVAFGLGLVAPISWPDIALIWGYCVVWIFIEDWAKLATYHHMDLSGPRHRSFLDRLQMPLHAYGKAHGGRSASGD
ncbi:MAG: HAD-IC family P-type ATPase, partial [Deinococcales bacterium]